ncbi:hypothetical protein CRP01_33500 [Flavilitoribacter nigricans DSM 23189 = NBRC 102662]|uniref:Uncharacterized protein n=2 Tax=Flavilitoribacter TaxID=2762562 RepID=A0A2D0N0X1_FLAN2|nr:hypothetical protein CRP01_33500 [Flavilitoribacter nigricans DSM 23189 = NBRC 102662]
MNKFAVYHLDSNQMIFSEDDISAYQVASHTFIFTPAGAEKMKAYQASLQIDAGLYQKPFVARLGQEEMYRGKFWTNLSSLSESGIVLTDITLISPDHPTLTVAGSYPSEAISPDNRQKINNPKILEHFNNIGKSK